MQTALHILALVGELRQEAIGGKIVSTEFYKKERAAYFFIRKGKSTSALGFVYHPAGSGFFFVPAGKVKLDTREKPWPVFGLDGAEIEDVMQHGLDRIFSITVEKENRILTILFEAIGPNGNIWLLDDDSHIQATLRKRKFNKGEKRLTAPPPDKLNPFELTPETFAQRLAKVTDKSLSLVGFIGKQVLGFNRTLAIETVTRASLEFVECGNISESDVMVILEAIRELAERFKHPDAGFLYMIDGAVEVYPFKLNWVDVQPEKYKTLSLAVQSMTVRRRIVVSAADEQKTVMAAVRRAIRKLEKRLEKVEQDIEQAADYEKHKKLAELLQINRDRIRRGIERVTVEDVYADQHTEVEIALDPALSPRENIESFFRKYRKGREGLELLKRRLEISCEELEQIRTMLSALESDFATASERYRAELSSLMPRVATKEGVQPRLPYREHQLSTGLTVYVGRDGADNDRTTFDFARPYELWFHAQQCASSHVVMKFPNKSFQPSRREIEETAAIAAYHSKARKDSLVPIIYTERRYVRKPRKAKPGLVMVQREKSIMVTPQKPE